MCPREDAVVARVGKLEHECSSPQMIAVLAAPTSWDDLISQACGFLWPCKLSWRAKANLWFQICEEGSFFYFKNST